VHIPDLRADQSRGRDAFEAAILIGLEEQPQFARRRG
jgi:hypothetical protein